MNIKDYDVIVISTSGGKDSQAMLDYVVRLARDAGVIDRVHAVHCDLGRVEWKGTRELVEKQCAAYQIPLHLVSRPQGDLLEHVEQRGMWPDSARRYCTSDHKRGQADKVIRKLAGEVEQRTGRPARVLSCMGLRAEESPARAKKPQSWTEDRLCTKAGRTVTVWLPLQDWSEQQVWSTIKASGVPHHPAYDLGMPRLSCVFCIFAPRAALVLAGKHNPELLTEYVRVEQKIGHKFKQKLSLADVQRAVEAGESVESLTGAWNM